MDTTQADVDAVYADLKAAMDKLAASLPGGDGGNTDDPDNDGNQGNTGNPDNDGNQGNTGNPDNDGNQGNAGDTGNNGNQGNAGDTGSNGNSGSSADKGGSKRKYSEDRRYSDSSAGCDHARRGGMRCDPPSQKKKSKLI